MFLNDLFNWIDYQPHAGQREFHDSDARFKLLIAGARFGKSLAAAREVLTDLLCGDTRGWFVAPTFALAQPEFRFLLEDLQELGVKPSQLKNGGRQGPSVVMLPWGAEAHTVSTHRPESMLGEELDWAVMCEAAHVGREAFERYLRPRLATRKGRMIATTTPRGRNWVYELYFRVLKRVMRDWATFRFATWHNPGIGSDEVASARELLPPEVFDEQYGGEFTGRSGRVYAEFAVPTHVREGQQPPAGEVFFKAVDFGFTNPFVCLWAAQDGDGRLVVFDEYRLSGATLDKHAVEIRRRDDDLVRRGFVLGPCWADPAGRLEREELSQAGIPTLGADNALHAGINALRERLVVRKDGTPGLIVSAACRDLIREFEGYRYEEAVSGREPLPVKQDDHGLDALRYLCLALKRRVDWRGVKTLW